MLLHDLLGSLPSEDEQNLQSVIGQSFRPKQSKRDTTPEKKIEQRHNPDSLGIKLLLSLLLPTAAIRIRPTVTGDLNRNSNKVLSRLTNPKCRKDQDQPLGMDMPNPHVMQLPMGEEPAGKAQTHNAPNSSRNATPNGEIEVHASSNRRDSGERTSRAHGSGAEPTSVPYGARRKKINDREWNNNRAPEFEDAEMKISTEQYPDIMKMAIIQSVKKQYVTIRQSYAFHVRETRT